jgi:hypothetical protein
MSREPNRMLSNFHLLADRIKCERIRGKVNFMSLVFAPFSESGTSLTNPHQILESRYSSDFVRTEIRESVQLSHIKDFQSDTFKQLLHASFR